MYLNKSYYDANIISNKHIYKNLLDIPLDEYENIIKINNVWLCNSDELDKKYDMSIEMPQDIVYKCINVRTLGFKIENDIDIKTNTDLLILKIKDQIANLQKLSKIDFLQIDIDTYINNFPLEMLCLNKTFISDDKMLIINRTSESIIPNNIKYLNILNNEYNTIYNNLPNHIEYLHIKVNAFFDFLLPNLPSLLKVLSIKIFGIYLDKDNNIIIDPNEIIDIIKPNIKLPYDCKIIYI